jgi:hypothetical protein
MRISRRGATEGPLELQETDSKKPEQYIPQWKGGPYWSALGGRAGSIIFNVTKKEEPQRGSLIEVSISEDDVCALFNAMLERKAEEESKLRKALMSVRERISDYYNAEPRPPASDLVSEINKITCAALEMREDTARISECPNWNPFSVTTSSP